MNVSWVRAIVAFSVITLVGMAVESPAEAATFQGLGNQPAGFADRSLARGVSADGTVVVGFKDEFLSFDEAFVWTAADGMVGLGDLPGGPAKSSANAVSADGLVVVGSSGSDTVFNTEAFRWTSAGMVGLGILNTDDFKSTAYGVSADGSVVVGTGEYDYEASSSGFTREAFRWTSDGGMVGMGDLPGGSFYSRANGVSADGSVIVGEGTTEFGTQAYRWTTADGMVALGNQPGGDFFSSASAVSSDGLVVVGRSWSGFPSAEAFRWTSADGMVGLGILPGGDSSSATAVSSDGSVVVGNSYTAWGFPRINEAFIWDQVNGMRRLEDVLVAGGADLTGWSELTAATGISADGRTIVGYGNHNDDQEAFIAVIPEPASVGLFAFAGLAILRRR
jgi:probable HAF family extracellular repeat protein